MSLLPWFKTSSLQTTFTPEHQVTYDSIKYTLKSVFLFFRLSFYFLNVLPFQTASLRAPSLNKPLNVVAPWEDNSPEGRTAPTEPRTCASPDCRCPWLILLGSNLLATHRKRPDVFNTKLFFPRASFYKWDLLTADQLQKDEATNCNDLSFHSPVKGSQWRFKVYETTRTTVNII